MFVPEVHWRFCVDSNYGLALALSHSEALVWPYAPDVKSSTFEPLRKFSLPVDTPNGPAAPLPLGLFVLRSVEDAPGMVVVIPTTGQIFMWETVSKAAVLGLMTPKRAAIQGSIPDMFSGEHATHIINAEPSGVIIALSTGRLAHVAIRDPQGRAALSIQMLRGMTDFSQGGLFANVRSVLSRNSWKRTIVAIKAGTSFKRGQRDVLVATDRGIIEVWDTRYNHGSSRKLHIDVKQHLVQSEASRGENTVSSFELVDFDLAHSSQHHVSENSDKAAYDFVLYVLYCISLNGESTYKVAQIAATTSDVTVEKVTSVPRFDTTSAALHTTPHLCSTRSSGLVYITCGSHVVLLTLVDEPGQSGFESDTLSPFKECVSFRRDRGHYVQAHELEDSSTSHDSGSCLFMIQNYGLVRINPYECMLSSGDKSRSLIPVKSRIEQAIFFADSRSNPIQFDHRHITQAAPSIIDSAVYDIAESIVRSTSPYVSKDTPSLDQQLNARARYLDTLALYVRTNKLPVSYRTRDYLLSGAEKLAAQRGLWAVEENYRKIDSTRCTHLEHVLRQMGNQLRAQARADNGLGDQVRQWFIHDTWRAENIVPWILNGVKFDQKSGARLDSQFALQLQEAIELSLVTLGAAFDYRDSHYDVYQFELLEDALVDSRSSEYWTSSEVNLQETARLIDLALNACIKWMHQTPSSNAIDSSMASVRHRLPRTFCILTRMHQERSAWCSSQSNSDIQVQGKRYHLQFVRERRLQLYKLAGMGLLIEALELAEEFCDMEALVELMSELHKSLQSNGADSNPHPDSDDLREWKSRIDRYFQKFGNSWSTAFFSRRVTTDEVGTLFRMPKYQKSITAFLRSVPEYSKLSWINDITGSADYHAAFNTLYRLSVDQEMNLWSRRIELSISKISLLANVEQTEMSHSDTSSVLLREVDDLSDVSYIQERLYDEVCSILQNTVGSDARHELAEHLFLNKGGDISVLHDICLRNLVKLSTGVVLSSEELIDILTLIRPDALLGNMHLPSSNTYVLALRVLDLYRRYEPESGRLNYMNALIWRRCMIHDDWHRIGGTNHQHDGQVEQSARHTFLYKTLKQIMEGETHR